MRQGNQNISWKARRVLLFLHEEDMSPFRSCWKEPIKSELEEQEGDVKMEMK
jgi:hypothetical protein